MRLKIENKLGNAYTDAYFFLLCIIPLFLINKYIKFSYVIV